MQDLQTGKSLVIFIIGPRGSSEGVAVKILPSARHGADSRQNSQQADVLSSRQIEDSACGSGKRGPACKGNIDCWSFGFAVAFFEL